MAKDYVPRRDADFSSWFTNIHEYVKNKTSGKDAPWKHIPGEYLDELGAAWNSWISAYQAIQHPHTDGQTTVKSQARVHAEKIIRVFVKRFLHWPPVTDEDRVNMGLPVHKKNRSPNTTLENRWALR
ncbi:MAG: hypothetical protein FWB99_11245 [Treponema sp.]|nr:hypothetical protein [Treponema sp.]